jgi:hypothetical protein
MMHDVRLSFISNGFLYLSDFPAFSQSFWSPAAQFSAVVSTVSFAPSPQCCDT